MICYARPGEPIELGHQGESMARRVVFDIRRWEQEYSPAGTVELLHQRQNDSIPYPVAVTRENGFIFWDVTNADTDQICRYGKAELRYSIDDKLIKSDIYQTSVTAALGPPLAKAPEPGLDWLTDALNTIERAEEAADTAQAAVLNARTHAANAEASREQAQTEALNAQTWAENAEILKNQAQTAALNAQTWAGNIETAKNQAQTAASDAKTQAILAETAKTQVLNALENYVPITRKINNKALSGDITLNAADIGAADATEQAAVDAAQNKKIAIHEELLKNIDTTIIKSASGNPVELTDGAENVPVKSLVTQINAVQSGSGDPSPENIRPITGFDKITIARHNAPENILTIPVTQTGSGDPSPENIRPFITVDCGQAGTVTGGSLNLATGVLTVNYAYYKITSTAQGLYKIDAVAGYPWIMSTYLKRGKYENGTNSASSYLSYGNGWAAKRDGYIFQYRDNGNFQVCFTRTKYDSNTTIDDIKADLDANPLEVVYELMTPETYQLTPAEVKSVLNQFGYSGDLYSVSLSNAGTVYGGNLNLTTGVLTVTHAKQTISDYANWNYSSYVWANIISPAGERIDADAMPDAASDYLPTFTENGVKQNANSNCFHINGGWIGIRLPALKSKNEYVSYLTENPLTVVYKLAAPLTYQLTPTEITTLLGYNQITSDAGEINLTYRADPNLAYQNQQAEITALKSAFLSLGGNI